MKILYMAFALLITTEVSALQTVELCKNNVDFHLFECNFPQSEHFSQSILDVIEEMLSLDFESASLRVLMKDIQGFLSTEKTFNSMLTLFSKELISECNGYVCYPCNGPIEEDFDWGNAAVGGCFVLAGGLLMVIPGPTRWIALYFIQSGVDRIMNDIIELGKENGKSNWENFMELVHD